MTNSKDHEADNNETDTGGNGGTARPPGGMRRGDFLRRGAAGAGLAAVLGLSGYGGYSALSDIGDANNEASASRNPNRQEAAAVPPGFTSRVTDVGDIRMHYVRGGSGDPVVLVHG